MSGYQTEAMRQAQRAGLDYDLFAKLVNQESRWNPKARNPDSGAYGLTQVMPATARQPGYRVRPLTDTTNPTEQLRFGADYLKAMIDKYDGDTERALVAYNWGPGNADNWNGDMASLPKETRDYVAKITGNGSAGVSFAPDGSISRPNRAGVVPDKAGLADRARDNSPRFGKEQYAALSDRFGSKRLRGMGAGLAGLGQDILAGDYF